MSYRKKTNHKLKILIIGIDGGTLDLVLPWVKDGKLPNLKRLIEEGGHGVLQSTIPPNTPTAWTTFMTGKNPGKHGILDFYELCHNGYKIHRTTGESRKCKTIWKILSDSRKKVGIYNMPFTYPPEDVNGFVISGFDADRVSIKMCNPPELYKKIKSELGGFVLWSPRKIRGEFRAGEFDRMIDNRTDISRYLLRKYSLDIFAVVFNAVDKAQHAFWKTRQLQDGDKMIDDIILYTYQKVDKAIGELIQIAGNPTVMVVSDHGGGETKHFINFNQWLEQLGLLHYKVEYNMIRSQASSIYLHLLSRGHGLFTNFLPLSVVDAIMKSPIRKLIVDKIMDKMPRKRLFSYIDISRTKAFSWEPWGYGNIQINVKGVFHKGIVSPGEEYESLRDYIIEQLKLLKDPKDGRPVVDKVYKREEIYHGDFTNMASDLIIVPHDYAYLLANMLGIQSNEIFLDYSDTKLMRIATTLEGAHSLRGMFIVCGDKIKRGQEIMGAKIGDIAPTILHLMGVPVPEDMDGKVLKEIFNE